MVKKTKDVVEDATPAQASLATKTATLAAMIAKWQGMSNDDWTKLASTLQGEHAEEIPSGNAAKNQASVAMKGAVAEDFANIFEGEELNEEVKEKLSVLFEAAVGAAVNLRELELQEQYDEELAEEVAAIEEEHTSKLAGFVDYVAEEWMKANIVAIDEQLTTEVVRGFMRGLKELCNEHNIEIPVAEIDVIAKMTSQIEELTSKYNSLVKERIELAAENEMYRKEDAFLEVFESATLAQQEKARVLAEGLDFNGDVDSYVKKLKILKESVLKEGTTAAPKGGKTTAIELTEEVEIDDTVKPKKSSMNVYMNTLSRMTKR